MTIGRTLALAAALALFSGATLADADPNLQALLDQRADQQTADSARLDQIAQADQEAQRLNSDVGGLSAEQRAAANEVNQAAGAFQEAARDLQQKIDNLAANADTATAEQLREIGRASEAFRETADRLSEASDRFKDLGDERSINNAAVPALFTAQVMLVINQESVVEFAAISLDITGEVSEDGEQRLGDVGERLNELSENIAELSERGERLANLSPDPETIERRDQLVESQADRDRERREIENRRDGRANGTEVLAALGDRLNGQNSDELAGNAEAGERVQELALGLAGAGQRVEEINQQLAELDAEDAQIEADLASLEGQLDRLVDLLRNDENFQDNIDFADEQIAFADRRIAELEAQGENGVADILREEREKVLERKKDLEQAAADRPKNAEERARLEAERKRLEDQKRKLEADREAGQQEVKKLNDEKNAIAALQAELADLIRRGAPLGEPPTGAANDDNKKKSPEEAARLDAFIGGGQESGSTPGGTGAENAIAPDNSSDVLDDLSGSDPLGLDQFGFDADQGSTEDITGFNAGGGGLIPCPAGSNRLTPGTLVSNTALCFL